MIEATCAACGTVNRIAEADVPVGQKFSTCSSCKSRVTLPAKSAVTAVKPPALNRVAIPALPPRASTPPKGIPSKDTLDLADLPAPKRASPLAGAEPSKPAPRSALASADLPAPKGSKPTAPQPSVDLDDLMPPGSRGLADLPAPKPRSKPDALADLPAPAQRAKPDRLSDLPAPAGKGQTDPLANLPAPKAKTDPLGNLPAPKGRAGGEDLPAPKRRSEPMAAAPPPDEGWDDFELPSSEAAPKPGASDLPAPKGYFENLPQPAKAQRPGQEIAPKGQPAQTTQDVAPKGFFDDLPQPAKAQKPTQDVAPKGFFDDPPQSTKAQKPTQDVAPKGFFDDLPQPAKAQKPTQEVAPKGFFDDLPQPAKASSQAQEIAPKGFFDDLPQPAKASSQAQEVAPKGFFDDLPQSAKQSSQQSKGLFDDLPQPPKQRADGLFDDLPQPPKAAADLALGDGDIDLGPSHGPGLELAGDGPELDLGLPLGEESPDFQDLDLSEPSTRPKAESDSPIKIKTPKQASKPMAIDMAAARPPAGDLVLDLEDGARGKPAAPKITPKRKAEEAAAPKRKRSRVVLPIVLAVVVLGAGGAFFYQRHAAAERRAATVREKIGEARIALVGTAPNHWQRAVAAANEALELDSSNPQALGIGAEAAIAGALDTGVNGQARIAQGRGMIQRALEAGRSGPELERAQAIAAVAAKGQAERATKLIAPLIVRAPQDGWLYLYMGWAQLAKGDAAEAVKAFDQAATKTPATKIPALYGLGRAKLLLADLEGAHAAFGAVLQLAKDHVCAQVGNAISLPPTQSTQRDAELTAILNIKEIKAADPRCVVQAHALLGDVARYAGRLDDARQRYRDALALVPLDVAALTGLAAVEIRDGKLGVAADLLQKASAANADDPDVQLLTAELQIRQGKLGDAEAGLGKLAERKPPLPQLAQAHMHLVRGRLLEAQGKDDDAVDAFEAGAKLAGELDLAPMMAAITKLSELAKKDPAKAAQYRSRADQLLGGLAERAQDDPQLSLALGTAYLLAGDAVKAENFLRRAVEMRGDDPESRLQLAKAQRALGRTDDAIHQLDEAFKLDSKRIDIALELAMTYQAAGRDNDAVAAFEKLLASPEVSNVVRVNAGRYFAKRGLIDKAAALAEPILKTEPDNPGGLYLSAEGLMKAGKWAEARLTLTRATDAEPDNPQYLDALGRAFEGSFVESKDTKFVEGARNAYERAAKLDPKLISALLGQGRMLIARKEWESALTPLIAANTVDKTNAQVMYYLGVAYYGLRNSAAKYKETSAKWLEAALKAQPALPLEVRADAAWRLGQVYVDLNRAPDAARAFDNATRLGDELEKTGNKPEWLTETWYDLGDLYQRLGNPREQKRAWERYVHSNPKAGVRLKAANEALATSLQRY